MKLVILLLVLAGCSRDPRLDDLNATALRIADNTDKLHSVIVLPPDVEQRIKNIESRLSSLEKKDH